MSGDGFLLAGIFPAISSSAALECLPCPSGTPVNLSSVFGGATRNFALGQATSATIGDATFVPAGSRPPEIEGTFLFDAPTVIVPDSTALLLSLTGPFRFTGNVTAPGLFAMDLVGEGTVALVLDRSTGPYRFRELTYTFSDPIPEPATMLLVGTGVAALWAGRRRLRRRGLSAG